MQNNTNLVVVTQVSCLFNPSIFGLLTLIVIGEGHKNYYKRRQSCWSGLFQVVFLQNKVRADDNVTIRYGREFEVGASKEVVVACGTVPPSC